MNLKSAAPPDPSLLHDAAPHPHGALLLWWAFAAIGALGVAFWAGGKLVQADIFNPESLSETSAEIGRRWYNQGTSLLLAHPEHIAIDIKHADFQWIAYKRETALNLGRLIASDADYVPAKLTASGKTYSIKLRLKGDLTDHLAGDKWSFRIHVKDDETIFGMNAFSIQDPGTRNHLAEWFYHQALKREDVLSLRYDFVRVSINGKDLGIFALEEHFDKRLIEHNSRREGPILRFSESALWDSVYKVDDFPALAPATYASFEATPIDAFKTAALTSDSVLYRGFLHGVTLLESFRNRTLPAHRVFDVDKMATFMALSELIGAKHAAVWRNARFYYNPITARIEPIGYDGLAGMKLEQLWATGERHNYYDDPDAIQMIAIQDTVFLTAYLRALARVSRPEYLDSLYRETSEGFTRNERILHLDYPGYEFPYDQLEHNRQLIEFALHPREGLRAHRIEGDARQINIEIGTTHFIPVQVHGLAFEGMLLSRPATPIHLPGRRLDQPIAFTNASFSLPDTPALTDSLRALLTVRYSLLGVDSILEASIVPHQSRVEAYLEGDPTRSPTTVDAFRFLKVDESQSLVTVPAGRWSVNQPMILPDGATLRLEAGARIDLVDRAFILARGPVEAAGTIDAEVAIGSSDGTGQGLIVLNAGGESTLTHVVFDGLGSVARGAWSQTGAVVFHESPVRLEHVLFTGNTSEDALNIVRTRFSMKDVAFRGTASDAFDGDFTEGVIEDAIFEDLGNDGIDVSGSHVRLHRIVIRRAGDKALSAGEFSTMDADEITIEGSEIGVASKDRSSVSLRRASITDTRLGFAIFTKKSEFGPATAFADEVKLEAVETPWLLEIGSTFQFNGDRLSPTGERVGDSLYGNTYGKASE